MSTNFNINRLVTAALVALAASLASCSSQSTSTVSLHGAGASLPAPLYEMWFSRML
ncbi:MAG: hypothetical protein F6K19_24905 [Cyanothece sp. SIO1E1]|nr:hypothetical protein [Cyanothece sp. SIO1E1]